MTTELATLPNLMPALPEILLAIGAMGLLMLGAFGGSKTSQAINGFAVALLIIAGAIILLGTNSTVTTFNDAFIQDPFARLMKVLVIVGSGLSLAMSVGYTQVEKFDRFEYPVLVLLATIGMMLMLSANDLIAVYLGLELQSLTLYVLSSFKRDSVKATEAGLKYFVLGALSSGMLLYGMSLVYGFTGQISFAGIAETVHVEGVGTGITFGLVFILAGLTFKISAVPFHMWTPDVYEGAPTPVTAFLAAAPKVAAGDHLCFHPVDGARRLCRHWSAQYQAADGLFLHQSHGLCARWSGRGQLGGGRRGDHLSHHLSGHDVGYFCRDHVDAEAGRGR
jgi:NADH-quinone oxidoreductase subunit N